MMIRRAGLIGSALVCLIGIGWFLYKGIGRVSTNDALMDAAGHGRTSEVSALIKRGADVNYRFEGDVTPLLLASSNGHLDTVKVLLDAGADPSVAEYDGKTAISVAPTPEIRRALEQATIKNGPRRTGE